MTCMFFLFFSFWTGSRTTERGSNFAMSSTLQKGLTRNVSAIYFHGALKCCVNIEYRLSICTYVRMFKNLYTSSKTMRKYEYADRRRHLPRIKLEKKNKRNFKFERFLQSFFSSFPVRGEGIRDEEGVRQVARALH